MTLVNKITVTSWYDTAFTSSDDANVYENYNYATANPDGILQCVYRYFQDHERRRNLNSIYGGFQTSLADSDTDLVIGINGTEDAEAMIAGRIATMATAETMLVENGSLFPADNTYYICLQLSTITETSTRDGSSGETFSWVALTSLSAIDDTYLVVCSVDVSGTQTLFSNLVQLAYPYEVEANKFRPKYDHSMSFYVGDGDSQTRNLSVLMDYIDTTFYLPIKVDTIDEESTGVGVTIEGMLIKDITKIKADTEILYVNTIDDYDAGILTITPPTTITGAMIASSTFNSVGNFSVNTNKMIVNATSGNSTIAGTLDVTGLITGTAGFSGALTGNVTGNLTGDVTGNADTATQWETTRTIGMSGDVSSDNVNIDGTANITITNTVVANDSHTHITTNITDLTSASTGITSVGIIGTGTWQGTTIDHLYLTDVNQSLVTTANPTFSSVIANVTGNVTGDVIGNADTSTALETARTIAISGDVTATGVAFDGSANITISGSVVGADSHNHSTATISDINQSLNTTSSPTFVDITLSTKTGYYSITGAEFYPVDPSFEGYTRSQSTGNKLDMDVSNNEYFTVGVHLPHNAIVKGVTVYGANFTSWNMKRYDISTVNTSDTMITSVDLGVEKIPTNPTIDNNNYGYYITCYLTLSVDAIYGVRIRYEYSEPLA